MSNIALNRLQIKVLKVLAELQYTWRLTGGGALIAVYTHHRETRDLDLFFNSSQLSQIPREVKALLQAKGFIVQLLENHLTFVRLQAEENGETVVIDLVADPVETVENPVAWNIEGITIQVDTRHEIFINKLCALLSRSELRDLMDVKVLMDSGEDLSLAIAQASQKDSGFSALTLAWVLEQFRVSELGKKLGVSATELAALEEFKLKLIKQLTA